MDGIKEAAGLVEISLDQERDASHGWEKSTEYELSKQTELILKRKLPLPKALFEQYSHLECKSFMGIFPEIHRAWFTVDNRLFLWNYATGSDFYPFEGIDQIITSAAIVEPRPGVFVEDVKYLLAVSTTVEVMLLGVCFSGPSVTSEITLVPTQISVNTDNVSMLMLVGSRGRRLFMAGRDGCLHELTYQGESNSFWSLGSRKARKLNHSKSAFSSLIPSSVRLFFSGDDPLIDLAVDDNRDLLFALSEHGSVSVYDISKPNRAYKIASADAAADAKRYSPSSNVRDRAFLNLSAVPAQSSSTVNLVVVTTLGERLYYHMKTSRTSLRSIRANGFRSTPPLQSEAFRPSVHTSAWIRGALFLADARNGDNDTLIAIFPEKHPSSRRTDYRFKTSFVPVELVAETALETHGGFAKAWAIAEASRPRQNGLKPNESNPPREVIVLTNSSIHLYTRVEPRDHLEELLSSRGTDAELDALFQHYGNKEACAMCISLAADRASESAVNADIIAAATNLFFAKGGEPSFEEFEPEHPRLRPRNAQFDVGRPSTSPPPLKFSSAHDGICLHIARIVSPVWWTHITSSRKPEEYQALNLRTETLLSVREHLVATINFLESSSTMLTSTRSKSQQRTPNRPANSSLQERLYKGLLPRRQTDEALRLEQISISNLKMLAEKTAEALAMMNLLAEHQFHRLAASLTPQILQELVRLRFCELIFSETGSHVCSALLEALFVAYSDQPRVTEVVSEALRERAPSFFGDAEVSLHRGLTLTRKAARATGPEASALASEAVRELKPYAGRIVDLQGVCNDLRTAGALAPMAELTVAAAAAGETTGDAELVDNACKCAFDALEILILAEDKSRDRVKDAMLKILMEQGSDALVDRLFSFLVGLGPLGAEELFKWPSARVEKYLQDRDVQLLWRYFAKHGRNVDAAIVLTSLADSEGSGDLNERVSFLASAVHNAKVASASGGDSRATSVLREVNDKLDVAQVQLRILEELRRKHGDAPDAAQACDELSKRLLDLSTLYNTYARPWELWESELDALRCASYRDDELVKRLWVDIISDALSSNSRSSSPSSLKATMASLGRDFHPSGAVFPVPFIIEVLERHSMERKSLPAWRESKGWVPWTMVEIGVPRRDILAAYGSILEKGNVYQETGWESGSTMYLVTIVADFISEWTTSSMKSDSSRREISSAVNDVSRIASICRGVLRSFSDPTAFDMVKRLDSLEARVEKLARQT